MKSFLGAGYREQLNELDHDDSESLFQARIPSDKKDIDDAARWWEAFAHQAELKKGSTDKIGR
jgi:hypothetical protein